MMRVRPLSGVGLGATLYEDDIKRIVDSFRGKCFTGRTMMPVLQKAVKSATGILTPLTSGSPLLPGGWVTPAQVASFGRAVSKIADWGDRLAAEPDRTICPWDMDHFSITQALIGPYQEAAGLKGAEATARAAAFELVQDLADPRRWQLPPNPLAAIPWWVYATAAVAAIGIGFTVLSRLRGPSIKVTMAPAPAALPAVQGASP